MQVHVKCFYHIYHNSELSLNLSSGKTISITTSLKDLPIFDSLSLYLQIIISSLRCSLTFIVGGLDGPAANRQLELTSPAPDYGDVYSALNYDVLSVASWWPLTCRVLEIQEWLIDALDLTNLKAHRAMSYEVVMSLITPRTNHVLVES